MADCYIFAFTVNKTGFTNDDVKWTQEYCFDSPDGLKCSGGVKYDDYSDCWKIQLIPSTDPAKELTWPVQVDCKVTVVKGRNNLDIGDLPKTWHKTDSEHARDKCSWDDSISVQHSRLVENGLTNTDEESVNFMWTVELSIPSRSSTPGISGQASTGHSETLNVGFTHSSVDDKHPTKPQEEDKRDGGEAGHSVDVGSFPLTADKTKFDGGPDEKMQHQYPGMVSKDMSQNIKFTYTVENNLLQVGNTVLTTSYTCDYPVSHSIRGGVKLEADKWKVILILSSDLQNQQLIWPVHLDVKVYIKGQTIQLQRSQKKTWRKEDIMSTVDSSFTWADSMEVLLSDLEKDVDGPITFRWDVDVTLDRPARQLDLARAFAAKTKDDKERNTEILNRIDQLEEEKKRQDESIAKKTTDDAEKYTKILNRMDQLENEKKLQDASIVKLEEKILDEKKRHTELLSRIDQLVLENKRQQESIAKKTTDDAEKYTKILNRMDQLENEKKLQDASIVKLKENLMDEKKSHTELLSRIDHLEDENKLQQEFIDSLKSDMEQKNREFAYLLDESDRLHGKQREPEGGIRMKISLPKGQTKEFVIKTDSTVEEEKKRIYRVLGLSEPPLDVASLVLVQKNGEEIRMNDGDKMEQYKDLFAGSKIKVEDRSYSMPHKTEKEADMDYVIDIQSRKRTEIPPLEERHDPHQSAASANYSPKTLPVTGFKAQGTCRLPWRYPTTIKNYHTVETNHGGHFNPVTGIYTIPTDGRYHVTFSTDHHEGYLDLYHVKVSDISNTSICNNRSSPFDKGVKQATHDGVMYRGDTLYLEGGTDFRSDIYVTVRFSVSYLG